MLDLQTGKATATVSAARSHPIFITPGLIWYLEEQPCQGQFRLLSTAEGADISIQCYPTQIQAGDQLFGSCIRIIIAEAVKRLLGLLELL